MTHFTVAATDPRVRHVTTSGVLTYSFPFAAIDAEDISVYLGTELVDAWEYAVSGLRQSTGGAVTFANPVEPGKTLTIVRTRPVKRMTDFLDGGEFRADTVNDALDSLTMIAQQLKEADGRAIHVGIVSPPFDATLPSPLTPRRAVMIDGEGDGIALSTYDPDSTVGIAIDAQETAHEAVDVANTALAAAEAAGATSQRAWGPFILLDGVPTYGPLPIKPPTPDAVELFVDGLNQPLHSGALGAPPAWEITDEHGPGLSITLDAPVRENPGPGELKAGLPIYGTVLGGITEAAIGNKTIQGRHIADGAIDFSAPMIKAGPTNMWLRTDGAGRVIYDTIPDVLRWTSVRDYGAVGDGVADDTAAIRAAIQAMDSPGTLYFPPGRYGVSAPITIDKPGCVIGMPNASAIVALSPLGDIFVVTQQFTHMEGLLFDVAPGVVRAGNQAAIMITTGNQSRVKRCRFWRQAHSIWVTSQFGATFTSEANEIYDSVPGVASCIQIDNGYDVSIIDTIISNVITAKPVNGILITAAGDVVIGNSQILCCQQGLNVYVEAGKALASLWGSTSFFDNCGRGASIGAAGGSVVRSVFDQCWFSSASVDHGFIAFTSAGGVVDGVSLTNCDLYLNAANGFTAYDSGVRNIDLLGCRAAGNGQSGIAMGVGPGSPVSDWSVTSSVAGAGFGLPGNGAYGIFAVAGAQNYTVGMNRLRGNGLGATAGINFASPTVFGNQT